MCHFYFEFIFINLYSNYYYSCFFFFFKEELRVILSRKFQVFIVPLSVPVMVNYLRTEAVLDQLKEIRAICLQCQLQKYNAFLQIAPEI